jgi:hypothetical protein
VSGEQGRLDLRSGPECSSLPPCYGTREKHGRTLQAGADPRQAAPLHQFYDAAGSWSRVERIIARVEAGPEGTDTRFIVTNLEGGHAEYLYERLYCARGRAENYIKAWKNHLAADRTPLPCGRRQLSPVPAYWRLLALVVDAPRLAQKFVQLAETANCRPAPRGMNQLTLRHVGRRRGSGSLRSIPVARLRDRAGVASFYTQRYKLDAAKEENKDQKRRIPGNPISKQNCASDDEGSVKKSRNGVNRPI